MQTAFSQVETSQRALIGRFQSGNPFTRVCASANPVTAGTPQVITIASGSPDNDTTYSLRFVDSTQDIDRTISYTTDGTATAAEVEAGFAAAFLADPVLAGLGGAVASTDLVLTMLSYHTDLTVTGGDSASIALLTITETTAPSEATAIPFGRFVQLSAPSGALADPKYAAITAPTKAAVAFTITSDGSGVYAAVISATNANTGEQEVKSVSWAGNATPATTYANAETALEAAFPGAGFVGSIASNVVTLTAPIGWDLSVSSVTVSGGSAALTAAVTQPGALPQLAWVEDPKSSSPSSIGGNVSAILSGTAAPIVLSAPGSIAGVEASGATPTFGGFVYVECAAGPDNGRLYTLQSATGSRAALPRPFAWNGVDPVDSNVHTFRF